MSMIKKLKSYFIVEDEAFVKSQQSGKVDETVKSSHVEAPDQSVPSTTVSDHSEVESSTSPMKLSPGKVNPKFMEILLGAMEKNNIEGFDYLEYKQSLSNLAKMDMDERTKYVSAYAAAQTMGATPAQLVKTANFYIDILINEQQKFQKALANQRSKQIGNKEQKIADLKKQIKEKAQLIEKLGKEIEKSHTNLEKLKTDISNASVKVESTKNDFVASFNALVVQIKKDIENMQKYLK